MAAPKNTFLDILASSSKPLLGDGAMGTMLNARGVDFDQCFEALNLNPPHLVEDVHRAYIEAGSQVIQTNTFGANRFKLSAFGLEEQAAAINRQGVALARRAMEVSAKEIWIAGDIGPLGVRLRPYGRVAREEARQAFAEQVTALSQAGADLLILETFSDLQEILEALAAARQVCDLPLVASMTSRAMTARSWAMRLTGSPGCWWKPGQMLLGLTARAAPPRSCAWYSRCARLFRSSQAASRCISRLCPMPAGPNRSAGGSCFQPPRTTSASTPWLFAWQAPA